LPPNPWSPNTQFLDGCIVGRLDDGTPHAMSLKGLTSTCIAAAQGLRRFKRETIRAPGIDRASSICSTGVRKIASTLPEASAAVGFPVS